MGTNDNGSVNFSVPDEKLMQRIRQKNPYRAEQVENVDEALITVIEEQGLDVDEGGEELIDTWSDLRNDLLMQIL